MRAGDKRRNRHSSSTGCEEVIQRGADRIVFGSDWPMADPAAEIAAVRALGLDAADEQAILGGNLARLLGLDRH